MFDTTPPFWTTLAAKGNSLALLDYDSGSSLTYTALSDRVQLAAAQLRKHERSLLLLFATNDVPGVVCYLASLVAGAPVFLSPVGFQHRDAMAIAAAYRPELVLCRPDELSGVDLVDYEHCGHVDQYQLLRRRSCVDGPPPADLALMLSTSASTGTPKAVRLSVANLAVPAMQVSEALHLSSMDRNLLSLPLAYVYGLSVLNSTLYAGGAVVLVNGTFADRDIYPAIASSGVTSIACVTQMLEYMRHLRISAAAIPTLRRLTHSGSPLDERLFTHTYDNFARHGVEIFLMYGQTEASGRISVLPPENLPALHRSVGRAMRLGSIAVSDAGEIIYSGPGVTMGYARSREDLWLGDTLKGVLATGDLGHLDDRGHLFITGRTSRHCKVFSRRVSLDEVEAFLRTENVSAAAIETDGVVAIFVERATAAAMPSVSQIALRFQLPPQSFRVVSVDELPRTPSGKISYRTLAMKLAD